MASSDRSTSRVALGIISIGAALFLLLEMSARVYLFGVSGLVPAKINSVHGLPQTGFTQRSSQPGLAFELKPNLDGYFKLARFRTNSRGLRDGEYDLVKPANYFRVAVVGASFARPAVSLYLRGSRSKVPSTACSKRSSPNDSLRCATSSSTSQWGCTTQNMCW
jgi:hypothetical protein